MNLGRYIQNVNVHMWLRLVVEIMEPAFVARLSVLYKGEINTNLIQGNKTNITKNCQPELEKSLEEIHQHLILRLNTYQANSQGSISGQK